MTTEITYDTVIGIDNAPDGYDVNIPLPHHMKRITNGIIDNVAFVGTFPTYPKALAAAYAYCSKNNLNPIEVIH